MNPKQLHRLLAALAIPILCPLSGCLILPVNSPALGSRSNVSAEETQWLAPGRTSRHEVVLHLGEPDDASLDDSRLTYRWEKVTLVALWVAGGGYSAAAGQATLGSRYALELWFDADGKLQDWKVHHSDLGLKQGATF